MSADYHPHPTPTYSPPIQKSGSSGSSFADFPTTYGEEQLVGKFPPYAACPLSLPRRFATLSRWSPIAQNRARPQRCAYAHRRRRPPSCARVIGACVVGDGPR
eukprot:scaffold31871_cov72-Phaeocystis_antarctica.AAC.4